MTDTKPSTATAILYGLVAIALLTAMDGFIKALAAHASTMQIMLLRSAASIVWIVPYILIAQVGWPSRASLPGHARRVGLMIVSNGTFYYALGRLPLAEVFAINFIAPIFIVLFGVVFLGEGWGRNTVLGILLGAAGMFVIMSPHVATFGQSSGALDGYAAAVIAPIVYAAAVVMLRNQARSEHPAQIALTQMAMISVVTLPAVAATGWSPLSTLHWGYVAAIGLLSAVGYLVLVRALSVLSAVRYAAIEYTGLVWAGAIGLAFFNESPTATLWIGSAMIMAGAVVATLSREASK